MSGTQWQAQHFNAVAKEIRELFPLDVSPPNNTQEGRSIRHENSIYRGVLTALAINFASRFKEANPAFDPIRFLDACSPNPDLYPLSELWED